MEKTKRIKKGIEERKQRAKVHESLRYFDGGFYIVENIQISVTLSYPHISRVKGQNSSRNPNDRFTSSLKG